jgi:hypothetical protein
MPPRLPSYGTVDLSFVASLASYPPDTDGPVLMVNFMKYRERADYGDGDDRGRTGRDADDAYAPLEVLADIGATLCLAGDVVGTDAWDRIGIVQYPSRREFIAMQSRADFRELHVHKEAGMHHTIVAVVPTASVRGGRVPSTNDRLTIELVAGDAGQPGVDEVRGQVEGTVVGDGRTWTELRISWGDEPAVSADDRERAVIRPLIDRLAETLTSTTT